MRSITSLSTVAAIALAAVIAQPAAANVITINGGAGSLTCTPNCEAFIGAGSPGEPTGPGTLSSTNADEYDGTPSNEAAEAGRLNTLAGTSFIGTDGLQIGGNDSSDNNPDDTFMTFALYVVMKIGNDSIFLKNTSGGQLTVAYDSFPGQGSGLSHYTEFGAAAPVPLPAALWLMGAGIAGLGFARRRGKPA